MSQKKMPKKRVSSSDKKKSKSSREKRQRRRQMRSLKKQKELEEKKKRKKKRIRTILTNFLLVILLFIGLALIFNNQIKNYMVKNLSKNHQLSTLDVSTIKENEEKEATFDFDAVDSVDLNAVLNARLHPEDVSIVGGIAIPSITLNLPIIRGLSNYALIVGAGTMKPDQKMGEGNYALASHHMIQENLLFGPLANIELGSTIYLTDLENVYEYQTSFKEYVTPDRTDLIEDVPDKTLVSLVTCDTTGAQRLVVQGDFISKTPVSEATPEMGQAFDLETNTYK